MNNKNKKILLVMMFFVVAVIFAKVDIGYVAADPIITNYQPLTPLPGVTDNLPTYGVGSVDFTSYVGGWVKLLIGIAAVLAVIMIVIGGVQYMSTDAVSGKSDGREKITSALWGLLLAIVCYLILNTINPNLLKFNLNLQNTTGGPPPPPALGTCWQVGPGGSTAISCSGPGGCSSLTMSLCVAGYCRANTGVLCGPTAACTGSRLGVPDVCQ